MVRYQNFESVIGTPVILPTVTGSDRVDIGQIDVNTDGTFTHVILTDGPLWVSDMYTVKAFYDANNSAETTFQFTASSYAQTASKIEYYLIILAMI